MAVIQAFSGDQPSMTLSEVARATGLTRAAARRFLITLEELGYVASNGREFSLRPSVMKLGYAYLSSLSLSDIAQPYMEGLVETVHESCSVAVLDGLDIVYVVRVPTKRIMTIALSLGSRLPAYATSMGRILLANLPPTELEDFFRKVTLKPLTPCTITDPQLLREKLGQAQKQGWSMVDQELEQGLRSIAAPIFNRNKQVVAALNVSTQANRVSLDQLLNEFLPHLKECVERISAELALHR